MCLVSLKKLTSCKKIRHFCLLITLITSSAQIAANGRFPSSTVPQDNFDSLPLGRVSSWYDSAVAEDRSGVMVTVRDNLASWQQTDQFKQNWGVDFPEFYSTPDQDYRAKYVKKQAIRYLDKRLTGEIKHAKKGSALHRVNSVQQALKPKAEASIAKNIKLKFKAQVLQGVGKIDVKNPWVDMNAKVRTNGNMELHLGRKFASLGVNANVDYNKNNKNYITSVERPLSETVTARVTSTQNDSTAPFTTNSDARFGLYYSKPF